MLLFECLGLNPDVVNKALENVLGWLDDMHMENIGDDLCREMQEIMKKENPFLLWTADTERYGEHVFASPEDKMIFLIFEEASIRIREKYPNAVIVYKSNGYYSTFSVDDKTYATAKGKGKCTDAK